MLCVLNFQLWEKTFAARKEIDTFEADEDSLIKNMKNWIEVSGSGKQTLTQIYIRKPENTLSGFLYQTRPKPTI